MKRNRVTLRLFLGMLAISLASCRGQAIDENKPGGPQAAAGGQATEIIQKFLRVKDTLEQAEKARLTAGTNMAKVPEDVYDTVLPLAKVKLDQAMLYLDTPEVYPITGMKEALASMARRPRADFGNRTGKALKLLDEIPRLIDRMAMEENGIGQIKGALVERAYIAANDGSAQLYNIYVPKKYTPDHPWPLFVFLHGWVPETSKINPWLCPSEVLPVADKMGFLYLQPHGRRNTDFQYVGEIDVLETIRQVRRFYSVDEDRIYLFGASMGGAGVWHLAVHYPHEFAAACPINGQVDWFAFWSSDLFRYPVREKLPKHQQWMIALNNPTDLLGSLLALPLYVQQSVRDNINHPRHIESALEKLGALGCPVESFFDPDPLGHFIYWETPVYERTFDTLVKYRRNRSPKLIQHHTYSLRFPTAYWATIDQFEQWGPMAQIRAECKENTIEVQTRNVGSYHLAVPRELIQDGASVKLISNGAVKFEGPLPADRMLRVTGPPAGKLAKSHRVCGPIPDAFNFPFTVVPGTLGSPAETRDLQALSQQFLTNWWVYAEGLPPVKKDIDLTEEDIQSRNLVLFGRPSNHAFLARIAEQLPIRIGDDFFQIGERRFTGAQIGLAMTYPNPLNPARYVVIFSGYPWGEKRASNHKFDLLPDFIVFNERMDAWVESNHALCAGFFDIGWNLSPELTWHYE